MTSTAPSSRASACAPAEPSASAADAGPNPRRQWLSATAAVALGGLLGTSAQAQSTPRPFPANALRGTLLVTLPPEVELNGNAARLAPGARIRGQDNLLLLPGRIAGQTLTVNYTTELQGLLLDVWVLTDEEAARTPWPTTAAEAQAWTFDAASQTWTKP